MNPREMETVKEDARGRLDALLDEFGADPSCSDDLGVPRSSSGDPFFTARVLDALPEPLRWTGASPLTRVATLLAFHVAAAVVGVIVYRWASPRFFDQLSDRVSELSASPSAEGASPWAASLALAPGMDTASPGLAMLLVVLVVGLVAFWATRSHTRAT